MTTEFYRGYEIVATAHQVKNIDEWSVDVHICVRKGSGIVGQQHPGPGVAYTSEQEAIKAGLIYGKQIIDIQPDPLKGP